ncbi:MAG: helix-turn-helix transcriptional regulator [Herpetosiphonaceae bacterium]|nr:helix-turn-helix transcriptional regulator [Herpetosiphonaceae bacterium]
MSRRLPPEPLPPLPKPRISVNVRLVQMRMERRLSQRELADASGLTRDTISRFERGLTRLPQPQTIQSLAVAFGMTEDELKRSLGMVGPGVRLTYEPPVVRYSAGAQHLLDLFEQLTLVQQQYIEGVCLQMVARTKLDADDG